MSTLLEKWLNYFRTFISLANGFPNRYDYYLIWLSHDGNLQVKIGIQGAEECGELEEWFNYRLSRAAPEACAEFLGSFVAEETTSQFTKGGKWLVWKFEVQFCRSITDALNDN